MGCLGLTSHRKATRLSVHWLPTSLDVGRVLWSGFSQGSTGPGRFMAYHEEEQKQSTEASLFLWRWLGVGCAVMFVALWLRTWQCTLVAVGAVTPGGSLDSISAPQHKTSSCQAVCPARPGAGEKGTGQQAKGHIAGGCEGQERRQSMPPSTVLQIP